MNRRHLVKAMLSVPIAGALGGCRHEHKDHPFFPPSRGGTFQVILQGPFAVVIDTKNHYRITAFVPYSDNNDHEFRYAVPFDPDNKNVFPESMNGKRNKYQFGLNGEKYLEKNDQMPHIDAGFADFTLNVNGWKPSQNDYFVSLDLPAPELITYRISDPLQLGRMAGDKLVVLRPSHVLQYRVRDFDDLKKVSVHPPQLEEKHPLSCADLGSGMGRPGMAAEMAGPKRAERMATEFDRCSNAPVSALFFGVGPHPLPTDDEGDPPFIDHALKFYNNSLLKAFSNTPGIDQYRLVDANVQVCKPPGPGGTSMFVAAAQRYSMPQPRLVPVTSLTDCRASGLTAVNHP